LNVVAVCCAVLLGPTIAAAQDKPDPGAKAIATRHGFMKLVIWEAGPLFGMAKGIDTLPAATNDAPAHDLPVLFRLRRGLGLWKALYMDYAPFTPIPGADSQVNRGAYLVTGPGHCGECHTPRDLLGGPDADWAFSGSPAPEEKDSVPNITPHEDGIGDWSVRDITIALELGLLPGFDTFGGVMIPVQENMAKLTAEDREAIAAYLKSLPPKPSRWKK